MTDFAGDMDQEEQLARIRRMQEETRKFVEESHKLAAEARKMGRDHQLAGWQLVITGMTAGAALIGASVGGTVALIKLFGP